MGVHYNCSYWLDPIMRSYIMSERSRVEGARTRKYAVSDKKWISSCLEANACDTLTHTLICTNTLFSYFCATLCFHYLFMEFPMSTLASLSSLFSLSLHLSLFLYCCVAPGDTVMCPPSVPPSLSLSLCPCHLQLLCETRHTAWGREAGWEEQIEGGREGRE